MAILPVVDGSVQKAKASGDGLSCERLAVKVTLDSNAEGNINEEILTPDDVPKTPEHDENAVVDADDIDATEVKVSSNELVTVSDFEAWEEQSCIVASHMDKEAVAKPGLVGSGELSIIDGPSKVSKDPKDPEVVLEKAELVRMDSLAGNDESIAKNRGRRKCALYKRKSGQPRISDFYKNRH